MRKKWSFEEEGQPVQWACMGWFEQPSAMSGSSSLRPAHYTYDYHEQSTPAADSSGRPAFGPFTRAQQEHKRDQEPATRARAVFIFLRSIGRVFLLNGVDYTFHLPFIVRRAWPLSPHGVIIQRILDASELEEAKASGDTPLPTIFTFLNPFAEPGAMGLTEKITGGFHSLRPSVTQDESNKSLKTIPAEEHILFVSQRGPDSSDDIVVTIDVRKRQFSVWRYAFIKPKDVASQTGKVGAEPAVGKRIPSIASPVQHRRVTSAAIGTAEQPMRPAAPALAQGPPAAHNVQPNLTAPKSMAAVVGAGAIAVADTDSDWGVQGRDRRNSLNRHELSLTMDRMPLPGGRTDRDIATDPVDSVRMQAAYWMERLYTQEVSEENAKAFKVISCGLFDQRWDGKENRSLLGICTAATQTLYIIRMAKQGDRMVARSEKNLAAISVASVRATREAIRDLLIVIPDGSLGILTHGLQWLPLVLVRPSEDNPHAAFDYNVPQQRPPKPQQPPSNRVVAVLEVVDSSGTLLFADKSKARVTIDLMPRDLLTRQCLWMLAMAVPSPVFFALHAMYLDKWSRRGREASVDASFSAFSEALFELFRKDPLDKASDTANASDVPSDVWQALSKTASSSRFREDSVLRKLQLPPAVRAAAPPRLADKSNLFLGQILVALHHVAEDMRLMVHRYHELLRLVPVLYQIAVTVRPEWADYWKRLCPTAIETWPSPSETLMDYVTDRLPVWPPDASAILYGRINNPDWNAVLIDSHHIAHAPGSDSPSFAFGSSEPLTLMRQLTEVYKCLTDSKVAEGRKRAENALNAMVKAQIGLDVIQLLPLGVAAPLREACRTCQLAPSGDWPIFAYNLIGRNDLAEVMSHSAGIVHSRGYRPARDFVYPSVIRKSIHQHIVDTQKAITGELSVVSGVELDLDDFTQIRFGQDKRLEEVGRMLCSSTVPTIRALDRADLSEHEQAKEHQHQVIRLAERTLALPLGRALFTFGSVPTVTREAYAIPNIEYSVRLQPMNTLMTPESGKIPYECTSWGEFHNGVAAGLRISSQSSTVESSWIKFNKPSELTPEHAGFLYALGLTGHLREMLTWHTFGYLTPKHDMTSIGVLLGLSAANVGTSNKHVTKLLAVHTPALLPTPNVDLNVPLITQTAGLMGIGLLYMGTKNRRMAEVCLNQISRKDLYQPDLSNEYREAYTLSAALACGMVMLGKGTAIPADLAILSRLRVLIHGEGHSSLSSQHVRPTFDINLTSPAATITLGLMFLKTGRRDVADILTIPDTLLALNSIQPSFLLLRIIARCLILWDTMTPTKEWFYAQIPPAILTAVHAGAQGKAVDDAYELAYYNILAGLCFAIALKYAGTAREEAYILIIQHYDVFSQIAYTNSAAFDQRIKRAAIRDGLNLISISLNMVMAGTGEINCLRRLRYSYGMYNQPIRYGTHLATHMSLGLLFLGGGRFTLGTSDAAIACMVIAFFPRFAHVSSDNKSYLQAFRHLWVLAVEPRCLIARDVDTKEVVYLPVKIKVKDGKDVGTTQLISPTLIPDLDRLLSIRVDTPRYWPFYLDIANYPRHKESLLRNQTLFVKRRTAFLSYREDPKGSRSLFVRSGSSTGDAATLDFPQLTDAKAHPASDLHHFISSFSNDVLFLAFADRFCRDDGETNQERLLHAYCHASLMDSILQDKAQTIQAHLTIHRFRTMSSGSQYFNLRMQDLRFATDFYSKIFDRRFSGRAENNPRPPLIREGSLSGAMFALDSQLNAIRDSPAFLALLARYANGETIPAFPAGSPEETMCRHLAWYLQRNSVPVSYILLVLKRLANRAHEQCLGPPPPEGTSNAAILDLGIKEVLHATGTQMTTAMGSGWSIRSLDEIIASWNSTR